MQKGIMIIHWAPRILCIITIMFVSLFSLDSFRANLTIWQQIKAFLMHLVPSFFMIALLVLAWKKELAGGIAIMTTGLGLSPIIFTGNYNNNQSLLISFVIIFTTTMPFVVVGSLFILSHFIKKKNRKKENTQQL